MTKKNNLFYLLLFSILIPAGVNKLYERRDKGGSINADFINLPRLISVNDTNIQDLDFLDKILPRKNIVLLGESSHGVDEYSILKLRLIKYLHEKLHFNTVFFESGISECAYINESKKDLSPLDMLNKGLFDVWHTKSTIKLMQYIKENDMQIYGLDNQYTSKAYSEYIKLVGYKINPDKANVIYSIDTTLSGLFFNENIRSTEFNRTQLDYLSLTERAKKEYPYFISKIDSMVYISNSCKQQLRHSFLLLKQILMNKLYYINSLTKGSQYFEKRDSIMGCNFRFFVDSLNMGSKVIVWAHNSHISKTGLQNPTSYLGKIIQSHYSNITYGIGLYAYEGKMMDNRRQGVIPLNKPEANRLEQHLFEMANNVSFENEALFQNFEKIAITPFNHWLTEMQPAYGWGNAPIIPINEYDGVILIRRAHIPAYTD